MSTDQRPQTAADGSDDPQDAVDDAHPQTTRTAAAWQPQSGDKCAGCGGHVTTQFRKSLGDENDVAHACPNCANTSDIYNGAAADPDFEKRVQPENQTEGVPTVEEQIRAVGGGGN